MLGFTIENECDLETNMLHVISLSTKKIGFHFSSLFLLIFFSHVGHILDFGIYNILGYNATSNGVLVMYS